MTRQELTRLIRAKRSYLCIGLDTDIRKLPKHLLKTEDPVFEFNRQIIEATADLCVAYKPNIAFYEAEGPSGWVSLERTLAAIPKDCFTIADAKRGDIGNTSSLYARTFFERYAFDSVTVAPYMGKDSVTPFLEFPGKWVILLGLTSNAGSLDFQMLDVALPGHAAGEQLFEHVLHTSQRWSGPDSMMYVIGATHPELFTRVRKIVPDHFLLVPGVGAQGGDLEAISKAGMNDQVGLLVNSSRQIIYASSGEDFAEAARKEAMALQQEMSRLLDA
ncbi:MAG TPA: orotidine-5'-phosphate decarboxylase [Bacteroidia bacterium]|nr:orotidine-5'-phosphate decarboxylase [Bacteroidia bacterium]HRU60428.1 orotidine-5'-phosphate decarboxylase [Bacteroidia bacterium]